MKLSSNFKRILSFVLLVTLTFTLCACSKASSQGSDVSTNPVVPTPSYTVAVIRSAVDENNENAYNGFVSALKDNGFTEGVNLTLVVNECEGDSKKAAAFAAQSTGDEVDLIFVTGEIAAKAAAKATTEIPIVFAGVADPIEAGLLKSCEKPNRNITGVSDFAPVNQQFKLIKTLLPKAKNISGLYYTSDENSILISTLAAKEAKTHGLTYTPYTAATKNEYKKSLLTGLNKGDALYISDDKLIDTYIDLIIKVAKDKKVPVFTSDKSLMDKGCVGTCLPDYTSIGYSAGELSLILLKDLKPISEISVEYADIYIDYVSKSAAEFYKIDISTLPENAVIVE